MRQCYHRGIIKDQSPWILFTLLNLWSLNHPALELVVENKLEGGLGVHIWCQKVMSSGENA